MWQQLATPPTKHPCISWERLLGPPFQVVYFLWQQLCCHSAIENYSNRNWIIHLRQKRWHSLNSIWKGEQCRSKAYEDKTVLVVHSPLCENTKLFHLHRSLNSKYDSAGRHCLYFQEQCSPRWMAKLVRWQLWCANTTDGTCPTQQAFLIFSNRDERQTVCLPSSSRARTLHRKQPNTTNKLRRLLLFFSAYLS